jgi:hypothetical protein
VGTGVVEDGGKYKLPFCPQAASKQKAISTPKMIFFMWKL